MCGVTVKQSNERNRMKQNEHMEDRTGTPMCRDCADDAHDSGLFAEEPWLAKFWK